MKKLIKKSSRPVIGISMRLDPAPRKFYLQSNYSEAIAAAGGTPVLVPLIPDRSSIHNLVNSLDGIVLSGSSSDINPRHYGASKLPQCGDVHPTRDATDFLLLEAAFRRQLPVLAICFGVQSLNVFLGGTLIQDIPSECPDALEHSLPDSKTTGKNPEGFCAHPIAIEPDSTLYRLAQNKPKARVNSSHHQAIETVAEDLKVTAIAPDGIIEGVELKSKNHFVLGVQWHPEKGFEKDSLSQRIFHRLVQEAGRR